jgi:hypothetical protein
MRGATSYGYSMVGLAVGQQVQDHFRGNGGDDLLFLKGSLGLVRAIVDVDDAVRQHDSGGRDLVSLLEPAVGQAVVVGPIS